MIKRQANLTPYIQSPSLTHFNNDVFCQELGEARTGSATRREYTAYLAGIGREIRVPPPELKPIIQ
jgi:hypothetical protein